MTLKRLYLDYDEVLVDLMTPWMSWINYTFKTNISSSDVLTYNWLKMKFGLEVDKFWAKPDTYDIFVDPLPGAVEFIDKLRDKYEIIIISYCVPENHEDKMRHAYRHFGIDKFISAGDKYFFTHDGVLVDDNIHNIASHSYMNKRSGIIFNYDNRNLWCNEDVGIEMDEDIVFRASSYDEVIAQLDEAFSVNPSVEHAARTLSAYQNRIRPSRGALRIMPLENIDFTEEL